MNRTNIEWVVNPDGSRGFTSNPLRGKCRHNCTYCYADVIRRRYDLPMNISWHPEELAQIERRKKPSTIFIGSMHDIFGTWVQEDVITSILATAKRCSQHTFLLLTKNPTRMWWAGKLPENVWFGASVTSAAINENGYNVGGWPYFDRKSFISFEPLLGDARPYPEKDWLMTHRNVRWFIIGALNRNGKPVSPEQGGTRKEWVLPILEYADKYGITLFIKDSLLDMYPDLPVRRDLPYLNEEMQNEKPTLVD